MPSTLAENGRTPNARISSEGALPVLSLSLIHIYAFINQKVKVALAAGLDVILCVGETLEQRKTNQTEALLDRQLTLGLADVPADSLMGLSIAYEPVWAKMCIRDR